ncbi:hypothetical protein ACFLVS_05465 [Chloroflexota bacterium]
MKQKRKSFGELRDLSYLLKIAMSTNKINHGVKRRLTIPMIIPRFLLDQSLLDNTANINAGSPVIGKNIHAPMEPENVNTHLRCRKVYIPPRKGSDAVTTASATMKGNKIFTS